MVINYPKCFGLKIKNLATLPSVAVVIQDYELYVHHSHVIKGNDVLFKCDIPSFVSDLVTLFNWEDSDAKVYQSSSASNLGKFCRQLLAVSWLDHC
jgi:hypothetical protein